MEAKQGDDTQARLRYRRGAKQFVNAAFYTGLLTVWRKLHVERDSMGPPPAGRVFGVDTGTSTEIADNYVKDNTKNWIPNDLIGAELDPDTNHGGDPNLEVTGNIEEAVTVDGGVFANHGDVGDPYSVDTDDADLGDLPTPDCTVLESALAACYVDVVFDTGEEDGDVTWKRNLSSSGLNNVGDTWRGTKNQELADYWCAYILACYDPWWDEDNDPNSEEGTVGWTVGVEPEYSAVYLEAARDAGASVAMRRSDVAHEIGHQFEREDEENPNCIMYEHSNEATSFCDYCKAAIREISSP